MDRKVVCNEYELEPIYYYRFGDMLKKTGNTKKGKAMI